MTINYLLRRIWLIAAISLILGVASPAVFAYDRDGHRGGARHETTVFRGERYQYHEGRFYRPSLFGFSFDLVIPPIGAVVSYLPYGCRTIIVGGVRYYEYDNVYYQPYAGRYVVVSEPVVVRQYETPNVVYVPQPVSTQSQTGDRETVTINVPRASGGSIAITLLRNQNGFVGPQGEFYPTLPTADQLRALYGN